MHSSILMRMWCQIGLVLAVPVLVIAGDAGGRVPGVMLLSLEHSVALFPVGVTALVFDTSNVCDSTCRLDGGLCVDSIRAAAGMTKVTSRDQLAGLRLPSRELNHTLVRARVRELRRVVPNRQPGDTIVVNPNTGEVTKVQDASKFFAVTFPDTLCLDSVITWMKEVEGVNWAEPDYYVVFD